MSVERAQWTALSGKARCNSSSPVIEREPGGEGGQAGAGERAGRGAQQPLGSLAQLGFPPLRPQLGRRLQRPADPPPHLLVVELRRRAALFSGVQDPPGHHGRADPFQRDRGGLRLD